ncbi:hypothetical protein N5P18_00350 [Janibacter terrae]|uniref:Uncharacterized protein n=1 Tax=Janibacter terrae TaxID=103817 RepID=A0ABZ2FG83_9MICO
MAFRFRTESQLDDAQLDLLQAIRHVVANATITPTTDGKFRTIDVQRSITPGLDDLGFEFHGGHGAFVNRSGAAITVHGGRAYTNNEVIWRVLQLAARPRTRVVVAVVPEIYKNGACATKVNEQIHELAMNTGVAVDLEWVAHAGYRW